MKHLIFVMLALTMTGCETLRIGFATDFGTLSYELPPLRSSK